MPRFAANLSWMFNEVPFIERFGAARRAGFEAVEFSFAYDHAPEDLAGELHRHGLTMALFNMPPGSAPDDRGTAAIAGREAEFRDGVETALRYAKLLRPRLVHVMSGTVAAADTLARAVYLRNLEHDAERFEGQGPGLVIEPINNRDIPGYYTNDFDLAAGVLGELSRPNLGLQFDIYHRQVTRGDVIKGLDAMLPLIRHVQIAAVPGRNELGTGELNDAAILRHLDAIGYGGFVGCEYRPAARTEDGLGWMHALAQPA